MVHHASRILAVASLLLMLTACGGGGSDGVSLPSTAPGPTATPTLSPTPTPSSTPLPGTVVWQQDLSTNPLSKSAPSGITWMNPGSSGRNCIHVVGDARGGSMITWVNLDLSAYRNAQIALDCTVKTTDVTTPANASNGVKVMLAYDSNVLGTQFRNASNVFGTFDWTHYSKTVNLALDATNTRLGIGFQDCAGEAWITDIRIRLIKACPFPLADPPTIAATTAPSSSAIPWSDSRIIIHDKTSAFSNGQNRVPHGSQELAPCRYSFMLSGNATLALTGGGSFHLDVDHYTVDTSAVTISGTSYVKLSWTTARPRRIDVLALQLTAVYPEASYGLTAVPTEANPLGDLVVIGDSWSATGIPPTWLGQVDNWSQVIKKTLGYQNLRFASHSGTGFATDNGSSKRYGNATRMQQDLGDLDPSKVGLIIVEGSINDQAAAEADIRAGAQVLFQYLVTTFGAEKIVFVGPQFETPGNTRVLALEGLTFPVAAGLGIRTISTQGWLTGTGNVVSPKGDGNRDTYMGSDGGHLTAAGHAYFARRVLAAMFDSLAEINDDMTLAHEERPHGVPDSFDWSKAPRVSGGNHPPAGWNAYITWGQVYEAASGNPAKNARVELCMMQGYYLSKVDGLWHCLQRSSVLSGGAYPEDFRATGTEPGDVRLEPDGLLSTKPGGGFNWHFWPTSGRLTLDLTDVAAVFTTLQARLVVDDPALPDDLDSAKFVLDMGADYWRSVTSADNGLANNYDVGIGRFKYVKRQWRSYNMSTMTLSDLQKNPPPIE